MVAGQVLSVIGGSTLVGVRLLQHFFRRQDARRAERLGFADSQDADEGLQLGRRAVVITAVVIITVQAVDWMRNELRTRKNGKSLKSAADLKSGPRDVTVITTASIPWMTGTSIKPILRVLHLALRGHKLTLMLP